MKRLTPFLNKFKKMTSHSALIRPLIIVLLLSSFHGLAQKPTSIEQMAEQGYAKRFIDSTNSLKEQQQALSLAKQTGNTADEAICYAYLALSYRRLLNLKAFKQYTDLSYEKAQESQNPRAMAYANWSMGLLRSYIDDKSGAITYLIKAYGVFGQLGEKENSAKLGADISYLFSSKSETKAKKYAEEALKYAEESQDAESILHARLAVGSYLSDQLPNQGINQWQEAVEFFQQTIALAEEAKEKIISKSNLGIAYINLAALYMNGPQPMDEQGFLSNLEKATTIGRTYGLRNIYRSSLGLRGQYFVTKEHYRIAEGLFMEGIAYQHTLPYKDNELLAAFYGSLKNLAALEHDFSAYYEYDQLFNTYNQLKYDENTQKILQNADARFESEKSLFRIDQLEKENTLQKKINLLGYGLSAVLFIGLVFMYRSYYYRQKYFQNREDILQQQKTNSELKVQLMEKETLENLTEKIALERRLLQAQMDPHFMFNLLGNIQSMILQGDRLTAITYLGKFAKLTRQVLEQSRMEYISLEDEIHTLKNYIELQQLRLNNRFEYQIEMDEDVEIAIHIPPLLIQPFVENAIEHGLKPLADTRKGILNIHFLLDATNAIVICRIQDNGIGLNESKRRKTANTHRSLSTKITDERLALLLENNPYTRLEIADAKPLTGESGCIVTITIPLK